VFRFDLLRRLREGAWEFGFVSSKNLGEFSLEMGFLIAPEGFWVGFVAQSVGLICGGMLRGLRGGRVDGQKCAAH